MQNNILLEACVESFEQASLAERCGADRIELCADLSTGGLTPSKSMISKIFMHLKIPIMVMIRPRAGNFVYDESEIEKMENDISFCKKIGVYGVVIGMLTNDFQLDLHNLFRIGNHAAGLSLTFHKAIDEMENIAAATKQLRDTHLIDRILTSGGASSAIAGSLMIKEMISITKDSKIKILPAGKITKDNLSIIHQEIQAKEYHGRKIVF